MLQELGIEPCTHPPYSHDITPTAYKFSCHYRASSLKKVDETGGRERRCH